MERKKIFVHELSTKETASQPLDEYKKENSLNKEHYFPKNGDTIIKNKNINKIQIEENSKYKDYKRRNQIKEKEFIKIVEQRNYKGLDFVNNILFYLNSLLIALYQELFESIKEDKNILNIKININIKTQIIKKIEYKRKQRVQTVIGNFIKLRLNYMMTLFLLILNLIFQKSSGLQYNLFESKFSNITLKIKGIGFKDILSNKEISQYYFSKNNYPNNVYINGIKRDAVNYSYYFNQTDNFVELVWTQSIDSCNEMFRECCSITEIDLSNFDSSNIKSLHGMFLCCTLLTSINFSNFTTSKVIDM